MLDRHVVAPKKKERKKGKPTSMGQPNRLDNMHRETSSV